MRKILIVAVSSLFLLGACNKNKQFNRYLDGSWITTAINGVPATMTGDPIQYQFSKSNEYGGDVKITYFDDNKVYDEYNGTYKISDEGKTLTIDATGTLNSGSGANAIIHLVGVISNKENKKFTLTETSDARRGFVFTNVFILEKQ